MAHPTVLPPGALGKRGFSRILQDSSQSRACRMAGCAVAFPARALACSAPTTLLLRTTTEDLALPRSRSCVARAKHACAERSTTRSELVPSARGLTEVLPVGARR